MGTLKERKLCLNLRKSFFCCCCDWTLVEHWTGLLGEGMESLSLEMFKTWPVATCLSWSCPEQGVCVGWCSGFLCNPDIFWICELNWFVLPVIRFKTTTSCSFFVPSYAMRQVVIIVIIAHLFTIFSPKIFKRKP